MTRTVVVIQARTGSTRLPGKVLLPLLGRPVLAHVVSRARGIAGVDEVVVATTTAPGDDAIETLCRAEGWPVERGSEQDLLDRYVQAARAHHADTVIRVTSDCPLLDPVVASGVLAAFRAADVDYASDSLPPLVWPRGLDVEVVAMPALEWAWREDGDPAWREHATPFIYRHPELFRLLRVPGDRDLSEHRWCVDTAEDYELVRRIYETVGQPDFGWQVALAAVEANPDWGTLNRNVAQKTVPG